MSCASAPQSVGVVREVGVPWTGKGISPVILLGFQSENIYTVVLCFSWF